MKSKKVSAHHYRFTDKEILERSAKEPWLFAMLVERYQKVFLRRSRAIVHSAELAEDVVQETFLKIYKNSHAFSEMPGASFRSWAYKILLNTCYTQYSRKRKEVERVNYMEFADIDTLDTNQPYVGTDARERLSLIKSIFVRMPQAMVRLLEEHILKGKSQKEIALQERVSQSAIRARIYRAKKLFKRTGLKLI